MHDVFHSSLLRIHIPNDDRLFPGRMDTQLGDSPDAEDEWTVNSIKSHSGSGENSIFEILWKSRDVTWMPYYQIRHLQALDTYLELMGIDSASKLVAGKGNPPRGDPQVSLGAMSLIPPLLSPPQPLYPLTSVSLLSYTFPPPVSSQFLDINPAFLPPDPYLFPHLNSASHHVICFTIMSNGI